MEKIEITRDNVKELWELYEIYKEEFSKNNYSHIKPCDFECFVESEVKHCENCGEYVLEEDMGTSELAMQDEICENCMQNGYGS